MDILYVRTKAQKAIFENELQGQLSDGMWENETTDTKLWNCDVRVAKTIDKLGCNFKPVFPVDFCNYQLIEWVGDRMIEYAQKVKSNYNECNLIADLKELTRVVYGEKDNLPKNKRIKMYKKITIEDICQYCLANVDDIADSFGCTSLTIERIVDEIMALYSGWLTWVNRENRR